MKKASDQPTPTSFTKEELYYGVDQYTKGFIGDDMRESADKHYGKPKQ